MMDDPKADRTSSHSLAELMEIAEKELGREDIVELELGKSLLDQSETASTGYCQTAGNSSGSVVCVDHSVHSVVRFRM
jgi:hypothetical protein